MVTWVLATVFVGFIMIIAGPAIGVLTPGNLTLLVVPGARRRADRPAQLAVDRRWSARWRSACVQSELQFLSSTKDVVAGVGASRA